MIARRGRAWALGLAVLLAPAISAANPPSKGAPAQPMGSLDQALIRAVVRAHRQEVRTCYEQQLRKYPELKGKVAVKFHIATSGSVSSSAVEESTVANAELERCVVGKVATWIFPKPKGRGEVVVTYPFIFEAAAAIEPVARAGPPLVPEDEGYRLMKDAITNEQIGYAEVAKLRLSPRCLLKGCSVRKEVAGMCSAFAEASRRLVSGATYAAVAEPINDSARAVCCEEVLGMVRAVGVMADEDKYTIWCSIEGDDGGVRTRCGWAKCLAFRDFWPKFRNQQPSWYKSK